MAEDRQITDEEIFNTIRALTKRVKDLEDRVSELERRD